MSTSEPFQDFILGLVTRHTRAKGLVLDLGAGAGLFSKRLAANGFSVVSADLLPERCQVPCRQVDLNADFTGAFTEKFDAICLFEVLEHVQNPRQALRLSRTLLKDDGMLFFSTPNASGLYSRVKFFFTGELAMFSDNQYESIGHITPITRWQAEKMVQELSLEVVEGADFDGSARVPRTLGDAVKLASWLLRPLMRGHVGTQVMAFAVRRATARTYDSSPRDDRDGAAPLVQAPKQAGAAEGS
jgi:SAM-dependent methyltransferase